MIMESVGPLQLDELAGIHHRRAVAHRGGQVEIVGDEEQRHAELLAQRIDDRHHLGLDGHVQRRGRLVGEDQTRPGQKGGGDHHPLQHPAGELVRIHPQAPRAVVDAHLREHLNRLLLGFRAAYRLTQRLGHEVADPPNWVGMRSRVLEHHRDLVTVGAEIAAVQRVDIAPIKAHPAVDLGSAGQKPRNRANSHRFARSRLAHESQRLARGDGERDIVEHRAQLARHRQLHGQALDGQEIGLAHSTVSLIWDASRPPVNSR